MRTLLAMLAVATATPAAAGTPLLPAASGCAAASDLALCLLRLVASDGGSELWRDEVLRAQPDLLARVGVTAQTVQAARAANEDEAMFFGPMDQAEEAVRKSLALDRSGRPPQVALAPILALGTRPPDVPLFFATPAPSPGPRSEAYHALFRIGREPGPGPGPALGRAAAAAWEQDLRAPGLSIPERRDAHTLALVWQSLGDEAGVTRALALLPTAEDRIETLAGLGRLDAAVAATLQLTPEQSAASARAELTETTRRLAGLNDAAAAGADEFMIRELAEIRARGDTKLADAIERGLAGKRAARPTRPPTPSRQEVADAARRRTSEVQDRLLMEATRPRGQPAAIRPLADHLLETADLIENRKRFVTVIAIATPARAEARLAALEAGLTPRRGADRLAALVDGWRAAGQPARAEALLAKAQAWGGQAGSPYAFAVAQVLLADGRTAEADAVAKPPLRDLLASDIRAGRGLQNFDAYVARARSENPGLVELVGACSAAALEARLFDLLDDCAERHRQLLTRPFQRYVGAEGYVTQAAAAARADQLAVARRLLVIAGEESAAALAADPKVADTPESVSNQQLIEIAKAQLRADGRLPKAAPPASPRTVVTRAP